ncbi:MAG: hypothetical protein U9O96_04710 [Candidatus Thermoplasmatota archaeon]|nr:hypothetical protein [Candidatus Thermoplasmatota archaeon]
MREPALRVFAGEYNESTHILKGGGEKVPSYVISPLGAKINRLFIVGVLTDIENVAQEGEMWRAHISDPTGIYTIYAGRYQPEAANFLSQTETPSYVAVAGKARVYEPEEGVVFVSVRPEMIKEVDASLRDYWIMETCRHTYKRMEAMREAMKMNPPSVYKLKELGYPSFMAEGVVEALSAYKDVDIDHYQFLIREALSHFASGKIEYVKELGEAEKKILEIVKKCEGEEGALWDEIVDSGEKEGVERNLVEEALTSLMDKGMVYEPILGKLKTA